MNINFYVNEFINLWNNSETSFPFVGDGIDVSEKLKREEGMISFSKKMKGNTSLKELSNHQKAEFAQQLMGNLATFFKNSFEYTDQEASIIVNRGFWDVTKEFMLMARRFDPSVEIEDVFQASRNLWIINSLQIMMNRPVEVTPSIFAYSMLYPYSDNFLDDPAISKDEKLTFSQRFRLRLQGQAVIATNEREKNIFDLVALVESDWDRQSYPEVYQSLLAIHDAQTKSIFLMNKEETLNHSNLLEICIEKGGTSVLADGYLIKGKLTKDEEMFCFGFGTYLQFADDIQDLDEDLSGNLYTLFTYGAANGQIVEFVNRTLSFGECVLSNLTCFDANNLNNMSNMMIKSVKFLLIEAIGLGDNRFPVTYVKKIENHSPFRFEFIKKRRSSMDKNRISLMKVMESFIFDDTNVALKA